MDHLIAIKLANRSKLKKDFFFIIFSFIQIFVTHNLTKNYNNIYQLEI